MKGQILKRALLFASPLSQAHLLINRPRCSRQLWALIAGYFPIWNKCPFSIWWICTAYCHNLSDIMLYCFNATGNSWEWVIYRTHLASLALGSWLEKCNTSVITVTHFCNAVMALTSQRAVIGSSTYYFFSADGQNLQFVFKTYWSFFCFCFFCETVILNAKPLWERSKRCKWWGSSPQKRETLWLFLAIALSTC